MLLICLVVVGVGWVYRGDLPLVGHDRVGSVKGAQSYLTQTGNPDMAGGTVLNGKIVSDARCENSSQPTGTIENPELSDQGVRSSWYQCIAYPVGENGIYMCVGALTGGPLPGVTYTLAEGKCHA